MNRIFIHQMVPSPAESVGSKVEHSPVLAILQISENTNISEVVTQFSVRPVYQAITRIDLVSKSSGVV